MPGHSQPRHQRALQTLLRELRVAAGLRQEDVAEKLGVVQSLVSKYESGERRLDILELRRLCKVLGISLGDFVAALEKKLREAHK
jgi:transcriptional regulator with XRE-family HTH domain